MSQSGKRTTRVMRFPDAVPRDPAVEEWFKTHTGELGTIARAWFLAFRACGDDVRELVHDGQPTACVGDAAFGYVDVYSRHANVGFFCGAELADPAHLLQGAGKFMRHVKLGPGQRADDAGMQRLIVAAYRHMRRQA